MAEGQELARGVRKFFLDEYALRCNLVHFETQLRTVTVCALTSSRLDDFSDIVNLYTVRITISFAGSWAFFFYGEASTPQIP